MRPNCCSILSADHASSSVMCSRFLTFLKRGSACSEMPLDAASEMTATAFFPDRKSDFSLMLTWSRGGEIVLARGEREREDGENVRRGHDALSQWNGVGGGGGKAKQSKARTWSCASPSRARAFRSKPPPATGTMRCLRPVISAIPLTPNAVTSRSSALPGILMRSSCSSCVWLVACRGMGHRRGERRTRHGERRHAAWSKSRACGMEQGKAKHAVAGA